MPGNARSVHTESEEPLAHLTGATAAACCRTLLYAVGCDKCELVCSRPPATTTRTICTQGSRRHTLSMLA